MEGCNFESDPSLFSGIQSRGAQANPLAQMNSGWCLNLSFIEKKRKRNKKSSMDTSDPATECCLHIWRKAVSCELSLLNFILFNYLSSTAPT